LLLCWIHAIKVNIGLQPKMGWRYQISLVMIFSMDQVPREDPTYSRSAGLYS
jgi:hypothetical protein